MSKQAKKGCSNAKGVRVRVEHLTKRYGEQTAVDDLSFELRPGEIVGFLGPNGAGKSTTMRMLNGLLRPDSGAVYLNETKLMDDPVGVRRLMGYLPENNPLYLDMYVHEFLRYMGRLNGVPQLKERVAEVIELTGLQLEQHKLLGALSKGYRQRVGLAHAILHDPPVLILDEPTSGLDPNQVLEIRALIRELGQAKTVVFSSHILPEVEQVAQRVMLIHRGQLKLDSPLADLAENKLEAIFHDLTTAKQPAE